MAKKKNVAKKPAKHLKASGKADKLAKVARPKAVKGKPAKASKASKASKVKPAKAAKTSKAPRGKRFHHVDPTRKMELPKSAGSGDSAKLVREVDKRVQQYERDILKARKAIERLSLAIQKPSQAPTGKPERGPRRFRTGVVKIRDLQREMTDNSTQMRIAAARRQELLWIKMLLTGEKPAVGSPAAPTPQVAPEPPSAPATEAES